ADCAQVSWTLFTLSIPEWSLLAFVAYLGFSIVGRITACGYPP
ncbi:disulfide bond formation protein B, partial [Pseudomonas aeruginosa]